MTTEELRNVGAVFESLRSMIEEGSEVREDVRLMVNEVYTRTP